MSDTHEPREPAHMPQPQRQLPEQLPLTVVNPAPPSFDTFLGRGNSECVGRLRQLVRAPRGRIWLTGVSGTGKSHLLTATRVALEAAGFCVWRVEASASSLTTALSVRPTTVDALLLDDADALAGDGAREALLMQLMNEHVRLGQECAFVLAAQTHPAACAWAVPDLRSRLVAAEQFRLAALEDVDREALLKSRAAAVGLALNVEVLTYLLSRLPRDTVNLLAAMERLDLASWRLQRRLTVPFVRSVLELDR